MNEPQRDPNQDPDPRERKGTPTSTNPHDPPTNPVPNDPVEPQKTDPGTPPDPRTPPDKQDGNLR